MIRKLSKDDINQVAKIEKDNFSNPWKRDQFLRCYKQKLNFSNYVYCESSRVLGYFVTEYIINEVHLHKVSVKKKFQNNKIGFRLIEHMIQHSKINRKEKVCLEVDSSNISAIRLYKKIGFFEVGRRKKYYESRDAILMDMDIN